MDARLTEHLGAIRCWLIEVEATPLPQQRQAGLTSQEKQDLLLNVGYLSSDDRLELQWSNTSGVYEGRLESDGRIRANTQDGWKAFPSLSSAAQYIGGRPLNGWEHWRRISEDGTRTALKKIREQYQEEHGDA